MTTGSHRVDPFALTRAARRASISYVVVLRHIKEHDYVFQTVRQQSGLEKLRLDTQRLVDDLGIMLSELKRFKAQGHLQSSFIIDKLVLSNTDPRSVAPPDTAGGREWLSEAVLTGSYGMVDGSAEMSDFAISRRLVRHFLKHFDKALSEEMPLFQELKSLRQYIPFQDLSEALSIYWELESTHLSVVNGARYLLLEAEQFGTHVIRESVPAHSLRPTQDDAPPLWRDPAYRVCNKAKELASSTIHGSVSAHSTSHKGKEPVSSVSCPEREESVDTSDSDRTQESADSTLASKFNETVISGFSAIVEDKVQEDKTGSSRSAMDQKTVRLTGAMLQIPALLSYLCLLVWGPCNSVLVNGNNQRNNSVDFTFADDAAAERWAWWLIKHQHLLLEGVEFGNCEVRSAMEPAYLRKECSRILKVASSSTMDLDIDGVLRLLLRNTGVLKHRQERPCREEYLFYLVQRPILRSGALIIEFLHIENAESFKPLLEIWVRHGQVTYLFRYFPILTNACEGLTKDFIASLTAVSEM